MAVAILAANEPYILADTEANILASTPTIKRLVYAVDTTTLFFWDGSAWYTSGALSPYASYQLDFSSQSNSGYLALL